jgi:hypothetical protein
MFGVYLIYTMFLEYGNLQKPPVYEIYLRQWKVSDSIGKMNQSLRQTFRESCIFFFLA